MNLIDGDFISYQNIVELKKIIGVYIVYNPNTEYLYIGSTKNFNVRFGTDLTHESTHTLIRKLIKNEGFSNRTEAIHYLRNNCKFKIEKCATKREAETLEHIAIYLLNPKLNH